MGYTTDFSGEFKLNKPLAPEHKAYLERFMNTRRMKRNATLTSKRPDPLRKATGLPIGEEGAYFVGAKGEYGQEWNSPDMINSNSPPNGQPGLWCQWMPNEEGTAIEWNGGEKFYRYIEWLKYLIKHFLKPWGYILNGRVTWQGESDDDVGVIIARGNAVRTGKEDCQERVLPGLEEES